MTDNKQDDVNLTDTLKNESEKHSQSTGFNTSAVGADDLTDFVHNILKSTQSQFETMSNKIINRIDDVTRRVDELEKSITDLMTQSGVATPE